VSGHNSLLEAVRKTLNDMQIEVRWLENNTKAMPNEGRAVDESWRNVEIAMATIKAALTALAEAK
jgi:hypothetical protein